MIAIDHAISRKSGTVICVWRFTGGGGKGEGPVEAAARRSVGAGTDGLRSERHQADIPPRPFRPEPRRHRRRRFGIEGRVRCRTRSSWRSINGTSSTKCLVVDDRGQVVGRGQAPVSLATPEPGWVDQDGDEIWASVRRAVGEALDAGDRETRRLGRPQHPARILRHLGPSERRSPHACPVVAGPAHRRRLLSRCGTPATAPSSAARAACRSTRCSPPPRPDGFSIVSRRDRRAPRAGELCIGTIDAFLLSRFGGEPVVEAGNASRTQLFDVAKARWDEELLAIFGVPLAAMPRSCSSTGPFPAVRGLRASARRRSGRRRHGRFPFRSLRSRRVRAGPGQGDARHRLLGDGPARPQGESATADARRRACA